MEFVEIKWNKKAFNSLLKKIWETESTDRRHRKWQTEARAYWRERDHWPLLINWYQTRKTSHKHSVQHVRYPETGVTHFSVVQTICCDLDPNFLKCPKSRCVHELTATIVRFTYINVSQGSAATQFMCGGIINNHFIANFPQTVPVKEFF